jgi:hypothetical protein
VYEWSRLAAAHVTAPQVPASTVLLLVTVRPSLVCFQETTAALARPTASLRHRHLCDATCANGMHSVRKVFHPGLSLRTGRILQSRTWISTLAVGRLRHTDLLDLSARKRPRIPINGHTGDDARLQYVYLPDRISSHGRAAPFPQHARVTCTSTSRTRISSPLPRSASAWYQTARTHPRRLS